MVQEFIEKLKSESMPSSKPMGCFSPFEGRMPDVFGAQAAKFLKLDSEHVEQCCLEEDHVVPEYKESDFLLMPEVGLFEILPSKIHGNGVIARTFIPANTDLGPALVIGEDSARFLHKFEKYSSVLTDAQAQRVKEARAAQAKEAMALGQKAQGLDQLGFTNFVNHSLARPSCVG